MKTIENEIELYPSQKAPTVLNEIAVDSGEAHIEDNWRLRENVEWQKLQEELEACKVKLQANQDQFAGLNKEITVAKNLSKSIFANSSELMVILDEHLQVSAASAAFFTTFQFNEKETEGVLIYAAGDGQLNTPELRTLLEECLGNKRETVACEFRHHDRVSGQKVFIVRACFLVLQMEEEGQILLTFEDITDRKAKEKNLEDNNAFNLTILENSPDCIKILDDEGRLLYMNNNGLRLMNIDDFAPFKNKYCWELWGIENEHVVKDAITKR